MKISIKRRTSTCYLFCVYYKKEAFSGAACSRKEAFQAIFGVVEKVIS